MCFSKSGVVPGISGLHQETKARLDRGPVRSPNVRPDDRGRVRAGECWPCSAPGFNRLDACGHRAAHLFDHHGAIVQIASGLMYTVDPRRVRLDEN